LDLSRHSVDVSSMGDNSWLAGFIDSDGHFFAGFVYNSSGFASKIKTYSRISQSQLDLVTMESKLPIMQSIADFLGVTSVVSSTRTNRGST